MKKNEVLKQLDSLRKDVKKNPSSINVLGPKIRSLVKIASNMPGSISSGSGTLGAVCIGHCNNHCKSHCHGHEVISMPPDQL